MKKKVFEPPLENSTKLHIVDNININNNENQKKKSDEKKNLITTACYFCRKRHIKCDGKLPCLNCSEKNYECYYTNNAKRGRKPKRKNEEDEFKDIICDESSHKERFPSSSIPSNNNIIDVNGLMFELQRQKELTNFWKERHNEIIRKLKNREHKGHSASDLNSNYINQNAYDVLSKLLALPIEKPLSYGIYEDDEIILMFNVHVKPIFPEVTFKMGSFNWKNSIWPKINLENYKNFIFTIEELLEAFEYAVICASGTIVAINGYQKFNSNEYLVKIDVFMNILFQERMFIKTQDL